MWRLRSGNKYHAKSIVYNGIQYHSKKEAAYAAELDLRQKAGDIQSWSRQHKVDMDVNGRHICSYYVDFVVIDKMGEEQWVEVKGFETEVYRLKRKLLEALYPKVNYLVVK